MIITWVQIDGVKEAISAIQDLKNFRKSKEFNTFQQKTSQYSESYWRDNIYSYFNARIEMGLSNTGQLGKSVRVSIGTQRITISMDPIYSRINHAEYGRYLREGFDPSPGMYWPSFDRRIKRGEHPGYDASTRWVPWMANYRSRIRFQSGEYLEDAVNRYVRRTIGGK